MNDLEKLKAAYAAAGVEMKSYAPYISDENAMTTRLQNARVLPAVLIERGLETSARMEREGKELIASYGGPAIKDEV